MRSVAFAIVTVAAARRANDVKEHQPGWGDDPLDDFALGQSEWPDCLTIPTFPGKCPIADHPGACYRTDGRMWSCWADWEESSDAECQQMTLNDEIVGFEGACKYQDYGRVMSVAEVPDCFDVNECLAECHPITTQWGACYVDDKEGIERASRCLCATHRGSASDPAGNNDPYIQRLLAGECLTQQIGYLDRAYSGLCKFPDERQQPVYQCESIPTFNARNSAVACNPGVGFNVACFSVRRRTPWQCAAEADMNPSCRTTQLVPQDGSPFYDGACVFEGASAWATPQIYEEP
jgi:hypothetical protein